MKQEKKNENENEEKIVKFFFLKILNVKLGHEVCDGNKW